MVTYKNGDLLKSNCNIICHQVNCQSVMGSGIAKQIRSTYPQVFEKYKQVCNQYKLEYLMGVAQICAISEDNTRYIANMFAQFHYLPRGINHTNYEMFRLSCQQLKMLIPTELVNKDFTIGFPDHIGCGLGGGDWNIVKKIIEEEFAGDEWKVEIWKLN